jgi:hypothetical protein
MSINLVLNSSDSISYVSGSAQFKVHWASFLSDHDAEYKVSFSFITELTLNLNADDLYTLHLDNIGTLKCINGGDTSSSITKAIGWVKTEELHAGGAEHRLRSDFCTNPPADLVGRPNEDLLTVSFRDLDGILMQKTKLLYKI